MNEMPCGGNDVDDGVDKGDALNDDATDNYQAKQDIIFNPQIFLRLFRPFVQLTDGCASGWQSQSSHRQSGLYFIIPN